MCGQDVRITETGMLKSFTATRFRSMFRQFNLMGGGGGGARGSRICIKLALYDTS